MKKLTSVLWLHQPSINGTRKRMKEKRPVFYSNSGNGHFFKNGKKKRKGLFVKKAYIGELNRNTGMGQSRRGKRSLRPSSLNSPLFKKEIKRIHLGYVRKKRKKRHFSVLQKLPLSPFICGEARDKRSAYKLKLFNNRKIWYFQKAIAIPGSNRKLSVGFYRKNKFYKKMLGFYLQYKNFIEHFNKKKIIKFFGRRKKHNLNNSSQFSTLCLTDSLFEINSIKRKCSFHVLDYRKSFSINNKRFKVYLNGKYVFQKSFKNKKVLLKDGCFRIEEYVK